MSTAEKIRKQLMARAANDEARLAYERAQKDKHASKMAEQQFLARHPEILMEELAIEAKRKVLKDDEIAKYFHEHPDVAQEIIQHELRTHSRAKKTPAKIVKKPVATRSKKGIAAVHAVVSDPEFKKVLQSITSKTTSPEDISHALTARFPLGRRPVGPVVSWGDAPEKTPLVAKAARLV